MDGMTATQVIRKLQPENGPKIVAITAYALDGDQREMSRSGHGRLYQQASANGRACRGPEELPQGPVVDGRGTYNLFHSSLSLTYSGLK